MYRFFEKLVSPYPKDEPQPMANSFFSFIWQSTQGTRFFLLLLIILSALAGAFEAFLYATLGKVVDWLARLLLPYKPLLNISVWQETFQCDCAGIFID